MKLTADHFEGSASAIAHAPSARTSRESASVQTVEAIIPENISADQLVGYEIGATNIGGIYLKHNYEPCTHRYIVPDEKPKTISDLIALARIHVKDYHDRL